MGALKPLDGYESNQLNDECCDLMTVLKKAATCQDLQSCIVGRLQQ